ncbi:uncharacterized protein LOC142337288 isoform X2 [Convolutriloba macropyga]|uniref:uncharacterized protein LOC142337288 isoform X2 n=1 Tax=Convolutriloba macropyga TaxID=536237 RepID=UPI003F526071
MIDGRHWRFSSKSDGKIVCVSSNCQLLTVYVGLGGILLSFTFIALTAVTLSHFWSAALRSMCGCLGPDSCMTKMAVGCYTLLLLFLWFIVSIMLPSLVFWLWDPWKDSDQYYPNRGFVQYHYAVFITVLSVGFGDMSLVPLSYCSIEYGFCMFAHAFLGSILAFVARFLSDERTVISDYYLHDDETGTATTSYRVTSEQESIPQYRGVII